MLNQQLFDTSSFYQKLEKPENVLNRFCTNWVCGGVRLSRLYPAAALAALLDFIVTAVTGGKQILVLGGEPFPGLTSVYYVATPEPGLFSNHAGLRAHRHLRVETTGLVLCNAPLPASVLTELDSLQLPIWATSSTTSTVHST